MKLLSIGPETSKALRSLNIDSHHEAGESTIESMVEAITDNSLD